MDNERRARWAGWTISTIFWKTPKGRLDGCYPNYETSLDACKELVEKAKALTEKAEVGFYFSLVWENNRWEAGIDWCYGDAANTQHEEILEYAETPELAICAAIDKLIDHLKEEADGSL